MSGGRGAARGLRLAPYMELPRYLRAVSGREELVAAIEELAGRARLRAARGGQRHDVHRRLARDLSSALPRAGAAPVGVEANTESEVARLAAEPDAARGRRGRGGGRRQDDRRRQVRLRGWRSCR